ncbi:MAG: hypothetical protein JXQ85_00695 [Cognatishimia sp.]|uniref:hypothetical protein n=1 Tax=Cognatishimia sp. TaxID=2211648 RepID=UPI003B8D6B6B
MTTKRSMIMPCFIMMSTFFLTACLPNFDSFSSGRSQPSKHFLADGEIVVVAPKSYCVDPNARASHQFVLLTNCDLLEGVPQTDPKDRIVLTVSSGNTLNQSESTIPLSSALGQSSAPSTRVPGLVLRYMANQGTPRLAGASASHWRGVFKLNNRIVTLAAYGPEGGIVLGTKGKAVLEQLADEIISASPKLVQDSVAVAQKNQKTGGFLPLRSWFQRPQSAKQ